MGKKKKAKLGITSLLFSSSSSSSSCTGSTRGGAGLPYSSSSSWSMSSSSSSSAWQWPSCKQPRTLSFRQQETMMKTMNSAYSAADLDSLASLDSSRSSSSSSACRSRRTASDVVVIVNAAAADQADTVVSRALRSDRLFFDPDASMLNKKKKVQEGKAAFGGATAMSMESSNPYRDFRSSMEAMVKSSGKIDDWRWLEKMLGWYLRSNVKSTHGLIVGAFVDLLVSSSSSSPAAAAAKCPSCCSACSSKAHQQHDDIN
uniref:Transcription repressor n=1 Tax=Leersia perrieri TaxID=77586 RepID=A0A0D9X3E3_9ORYZ